MIAVALLNRKYEEVPLNCRQLPFAPPIPVARVELPGNEYPFALSFHAVTGLDPVSVDESAASNHNAHPGISVGPNGLENAGVE